MIKKKYISLLIASLMVSYTAIGCSNNTKGTHKLTKEISTFNKPYNIKFKSSIGDIDSMGTIFIKENNKYICSLFSPKFEDISTLSENKVIPFTDNKWSVKMKDKNCKTKISRSDSELNVKFNYPNFGTITSPYYSIDANNLNIYKFTLNYSMTPDKVENVPFKGNPNKIDLKKRIFPFSMFTINYYDKNKKLIDMKTTRAYSINNGKVLSLFDYSFIPKKNTAYVTLSVKQFNLFKDITLKNAKLELYKNVSVSPINTDYKSIKEKNNDKIVQNFTYPNRKVVRTLNYNLKNNILNISKETFYTKDTQNLKSFEKVLIKSNNINYLGRDFKYNNKLNKSTSYVTDYTTPYFSKFDNNNIISCNNGYTSIETSKGNDTFNINIYNNHYKDNKYFIIGEGGINKYTFTQKFKKDTKIKSNYSILLNYKGENIVPSRTPNGTKGTFIITHHADSNTAKTLKTLMFGSSNENSNLYNKGGFIHYKLPATWAFFAKSCPGNEGIDSKPYKDIIDIMNKSGIEVVPHSIDHVAGNNTRELMKKYMPILKEYNIENWTDHSLGHGTRCSDIKSDASIKSSPYFSLDLFKKYGYKYCWSYDDVNLDKGLDMLRNCDFNFHPQTFFKNNNFGYNDYSLYQWSTYRPKSFITEVNKSNLDNLVDNNGIAIMHDYFTHPMQLNKFFIKTKDGFDITMDLNNTLKLLKDYRKNNNLWIPTVRDFIDYSVKVHNVDVNYTLKEIELTNKNKKELKGYTLIVFDKNNNKKYITLNLKPGKNIIDKF